jgi:hypothetical protein
MFSPLSSTRAWSHAWQGVESNDALYGGSAAFVAALRELRAAVVAQVLAQLAALKERAAAGAAADGASPAAQAARVGELACDLLAAVAVGGLDLGHAPCAAFAAKLVGLAASTQAELRPHQAAYLARTHVSVRQAAARAAQALAAAGQGESKALLDLQARTAPAPAPAAAVAPAVAAAPRVKAVALEAVDDGEEDSV